MKYRSVNEIEKFEFHDSIIEKVLFRGNDMILNISYANVLTTNSQNHFSTDMCVNNINFIFKKYKIKKMIWKRVQRYDDNNELIEEILEEIILESQFCKTLEGIKNFNISYGQYKGKSIYVFEIIANRLLYVELTSDEVIAEWDSYDGEAWYANVPN
jgi:hypothetical protein